MRLRRALVLLRGPYVRGKYPRPEAADAMKLRRALVIVACWLADLADWLYRRALRP